MLKKKEAIDAGLPISGLTALLRAGSLLRVSGYLGPFIAQESSEDNSE